MPVRNPLSFRVWAVFDPVIGRIEYLSESFTDCDKIHKLFDKAGRFGTVLLRFDLSPLYYDVVRGGRSSSDPLMDWVNKKTTTQKKRR